MRVLLVITDAPWYEPTGYAEAWVRALEEQGAQVDRVAALPAGWAAAGPPSYDLVVGHVLVEEVAAFAPTLQAVTALEASGARLLNPVRALLASADKQVTAAAWAAAGLPQPHTVDLAAVDRWPGRSRVLKPAFCDGARHIQLVHSLEQAREVERRWRVDEAAGGERRGAALLQEWVEEPACVRLFATPTSTSLAYEKGRRPGELVTSGTTYPARLRAAARAGRAGAGHGGEPRRRADGRRRARGAGRPAARARGQRAVRLRRHRPGAGPLGRAGGPVRSRSRCRPAGVTRPWDEGASAAAAGVRQALAGVDLATLATAAAQAVADVGMEVVGADGPEPLRVDPVPRVLDGAEWDRLAAGLAQRVRALEAFLRDPSRAVAAGVVPADVVTTCLWSEGAPAPAAVGVAGPDVVRTSSGELVVLEDNLRTPTLMGYAETTRTLVQELVPGPARPYAADLVPALSAVLRAAAPDVDEPVVAVLGDQRGTNVRWEPARVAHLLGVPLVDLDELTAVGDRLRLPDGRLVDVLWRRTSEERLRGDDGRLNRLGEALWPGLSAGRLRVVNPFGTGLADDKRTYPCVEDLVRFELGQQPLVRSVRCFDLGRAADLDLALERLDELVLKPRTGSGGRGVTVMARASAQRRREARVAVLRAPAEWVAQEPVLLSTCPTVSGSRLEDRHVDLRPCVLSDGTSVTVLPGGLTRVAPRPGELVVNLSQGGAVKDTRVVDRP